MKVEGCSFLVDVCLFMFKYYFMFKKLCYIDINKKKIVEFFCYIDI